MKALQNFFSIIGILFLVIMTVLHAGNHSASARQLSSINDGYNKPCSRASLVITPNPVTTKNPNNTIQRVEEEDEWIKNSFIYKFLTYSWGYVYSLLPNSGSSQTEGETVTGMTPTETTECLDALVEGEDDLGDETDESPSFNSASSAFISTTQLVSVMAIVAASVAINLWN